MGTPSPLRAFNVALLSFAIVHLAACLPSRLLAPELPHTEGCGDTARCASTPSHDEPACRSDEDCGADRVCVLGTCEMLAIPLPPTISSSGVADLARSSVSVDRSEVPADGVEVVTIRVSLRDEQDAPAAATAVSVSLPGDGHAIDGLPQSQATRHTDSSGDAVFTVSAKRAGAKVLSVSWPSAAGVVALPSAPELVFVQAQADAVKSTLSLSRKSNLLADGREEAIATLKIVSPSGGVPYGSAVTFQVAGDGVIVDPETVAIDDEGNAEVSIRSRVSGAKEVTARVNDLVSLPPVTLSFTPSAFVIGSTTMWLDRTPAVATANLGDALELTVVVPTVTGGASRETAIAIAVSGDRNTVDDVTTLEEPTSRRVVIRSSKAEKKTITVTVNGVQPPTAPPLQIEFAPGPADAATSRFDLESLRTTAGKEINFKLQSRDKFDNVRPADAVLLDAPGLVVTPALSATADAAGELRGTLKSDARADFRVSASFGGLVLERSVRFQRAWESIDPMSDPYTRSSDPWQLIFDPGDVDHVIAWKRDRQTIYESFDAGVSFSALPAVAKPVRSVALTESTPRRLYALTYTTLYQRDGDGAWQQGPSMPLASNESPNQVAAGGPNADTVFVITSYCASGTCSYGTAYLYQSRILRYQASTGWTSHPTSSIWRPDSPSGWTRSEYFSQPIVDAHDSSILYVNPYVSASTLDWSTNQSFDGGLYALTAAGALERMYYDGQHIGRYVADRTASYSVILYRSPSYQRIRKNGSLYQVEALAVPNGSYQFISGLAGALLTTIVASDNPAKLEMQSHFTSGAPQIVRSFDPRLFGFTTGYTSPVSLSAASGDKVIAGSISFNGEQTPRYLATTGVASAHFVSLPGLAIVGRGNHNLSYYDGQRWQRTPQTNTATSLAAGFDNHSFFEIAGNTLYERDALSNSATAVPNDSDGAPITKPLALSNQTFPLDLRYLYAESGYYARQKSGGWTKLASPAPSGERDLFAVDPETGDIYAANGSGSVLRYTAGAWTTVPVTGMYGSVDSYFVDPRAPGTIYLLASGRLYRKSAGATTFTLFAEAYKLVGSTILDVAFDLADKAQVTVYGTSSGAYDVKRAVYDGVTAPSAASACGKVEEGFEALRVDPFQPRHLVARNRSNYDPTLLESFARCE